MDGSEPVRAEGLESVEHRTARTTQLATGTLACPDCDAPVFPGDQRLRPARSARLPVLPPRGPRPRLPLAHPAVAPRARDRPRRRTADAPCGARAPRPRLGRGARAPIPGQWPGIATEPVSVPCGLLPNEAPPALQSCCCVIPAGARADRGLRLAAQRHLARVQRVGPLVADDHDHAVQPRVDERQLDASRPGSAPCRARSSRTAAPPSGSRPASSSRRPSTTRARAARSCSRRSRR